jgi:60 kDa SS-A/Ro ribonucleoprotein
MDLNDTKDKERTDKKSGEYDGTIDEEEIEQTKTVNHEGGTAFEPNSPERRLYKRTSNNLLENTFYENDEELKTGLIEAFDDAADSNPEFVLKLAAYARQEMGLRDVPQILLALAANDSRFNTYPPESGHQNDTRIRDYTPAIVRRMDETATVVSVYKNMLEKDSIPNGLQKGLSDAINMMADEYTLAKYTLQNRKVTLYDVFNLVHPEPSNRVQNWNGLSNKERSRLFERFMKGQLDAYENVDSLSTPSTWEVTISEQGNNREAWLQVVDDMGIMSKIRNVRNMLQSGLTGDEIFGNKDLEAVKNSKMFPFRFYQAYKAYQEPQVPTDESVEEFLSKSIELTAGNIPEEFRNTLVVADTSGSMKQSVSGGSSLDCYEIATFFTAVASTVGADVGAFASTFEEVSFSNKTPAVDRVSPIGSLKVGGSTNGHEVFDTLREKQRNYQNVVMLTDEQLWDSSYRSNRTLKESVDDYRSSVTDDCSLYIVDLQSYGEMAMPDGYKDVYHISGWSEDILNFISYANKENEILEKIASYKPHPVSD